MRSAFQRHGSVFFQSLESVAAIGFGNVLGLVAGILALRILSPSDYAQYALAFAMLGTLIALADAGVSSATMACAARTWPDSERTGAAVATAFETRNLLLGAAACVTLPLLAWQLAKHGAAPGRIAFLLAAVALMAYIGSTAAIWDIPSKLALARRPLQRVHVEAGALRLAGMVVAGIVSASPVSLVLAGIAAQAYSNVRLRRLALPHVRAGVRADAESRAYIRRIVGRSLPVSVYYCLSGQLPIWIMSLLGTTQNVAEFGALSRLGLILAAAGSAISLVIVPRFARLGPERFLLVRRYAQVQGGVAVLAAGILLFVAAFPQLALAILGGAYSSLSREVVALAAATCIGMLVSVAAAMNSSRGISAPGYVGPALSTATIMLSIVVFDVGTVGGVLAMTLLLNVVSLVQLYATFLISTRTGSR